MSPKNSHTTKASKTSFTFSHEPLKENFSSAIKPFGDLRDYSEAKFFTKKSTENLAQILASQQIQLQNPSSRVTYQQNQQKLLVELDETINFSPSKHVKYITTTKPRNSSPRT